MLKRLLRIGESLPIAATDGWRESPAFSSRHGRLDLMGNHTLLVLECFPETQNEECMTSNHSLGGERRCIVNDSKSFFSTDLAFVSGFPEA